MTWLVYQLLCWLTGARVESCVDGWSAMSVRPDGSFICLAPVPVGICDERAGCDDATPDEQVRGWLHCRDGERGVMDFDGRTVRCATWGGGVSKNAETLRRLRAAAIALGLCQQCRARPAKAGRITCERCLTAGRVRGISYRDVGLCACGRDPVPGRASCARCLDQSNALGRRITAKRREMGICRNCGEASAPGRRLCPKHLRLSAARSRRVRERRMAERRREAA